LVDFIHERGFCQLKEIRWKNNKVINRDRTNQNRKPIGICLDLELERKELTERSIMVREIEMFSSLIVWFIRGV
jgi:hypothetical protein